MLIWKGVLQVQQDAQKHILPCKIERECRGLVLGIPRCHGHSRCTCGRAVQTELQARICVCLQHDVDGHDLPPHLPRRLDPGRQRVPAQHQQRCVHADEVADYNES